MTPRATEGLVEFVVTLYRRSASGGGDPLGSFSIPRRVRNVLCSQTARDEHGFQLEEWIYIVAFEDVDVFEQIVALCKHVISYERSSVPGDCAKITTFFNRRNVGNDE